MDTSGLLYLSESYTWLQPEWKATEGLERGAFVAAVVVAQQLGHASTQLLIGALVLAVFQVGMWSGLGGICALFLGIDALCRRSIPTHSTMPCSTHNGTRFYAVQGLPTTVGGSRNKPLALLLTLKLPHHCLNFNPSSESLGGAWSTMDQTR